MPQWEDQKPTRKGMPREEWQPQKPVKKPGPRAGMFPIGGQAREEWEPQQNPGTISNLGNPRTTDEPDILQPKEADTSTTALKKGGPVKKNKKPTRPGWRRW